MSVSSDAAQGEQEGRVCMGFLNFGTYALLFYTIFTFSWAWRQASTDETVDEDQKSGENRRELRKTLEGLGGGSVWVLLLGT